MRKERLKRKILGNEWELSGNYYRELSPSITLHGKVEIYRDTGVSKKVEIYRDTGVSKNYDLVYNITWKMWEL